MKSRFPFRGVFYESLNIYPKKIFSLKLDGFLGLLGALGILGFRGKGIKRDYGFTWNNSRVGVLSSFT